jgi:rhodanese-related sulfurtransferase
MSDDDPLIPPIGTVHQGLRMFRVNWVAAIVRSPSGVPLLPAEFVARQGRAVRIIDVRERHELVGPLGHIPGSDWVERDRVIGLAETLQRDTPIILVSRGGERSGELAKALEQRGMRFVGSLEGGMVAWKGLGFGTSRSHQILEHPGQLRSEPPVSSEELTIARIERHIGDPGAVRFLKIAALLLHGRMSCVDGRDDSGVLGTPGGDGGEFLVLLGAIESLSGKRFTGAEIRALLARRLDTFGRFYIHTDVAASNALIASMRGDRRLDAALAHVYEPLEWRDFFAEPPAEVRDIVLEHMLVPGHIGCGHIRMMWQDCQAYGVRPELPELVLRSFMHLRWSGAVEAELVPLAGGHEERGVLRVFLADPIEPFTEVPLVSPSCEGTQMFVCHPQVMSYLRTQLVRFAQLQSALVPKLSEEDLRCEVEAMATTQMNATLQRLAMGLPVFDVTFGAGRLVDVEQKGVIA